MKKIEQLNPIVMFLYFLLVFALAAFGTDVIITLISLICSILLYCLKSKNENTKRHYYIFILFIVSALINPVFNHRGITPLFVVNDNPITLEALLYGICMAGTFSAVIYLFSAFSLVMTSDKLIYVFGTVSSKSALLLSMALRYVPLFIAQQKKVKQAQKAMGLFYDGNLVDRFKGNLRIFSIMVTWALENGIVTADSMSARGYSEKRRTSFSFFAFTQFDLFYLLITLLLFSVVVYGKVTNAVGTVFYPEFVCAKLNLISFSVYFCFALLCLMPSILEIREELRWKYLMSKI